MLFFRYSPATCYSGGEKLVLPPHRFPVPTGKKKKSTLDARLCVDSSQSTKTIGGFAAQLKFHVPARGPLSPSAVSALTDLDSWNICSGFGILHKVQFSFPVADFGHICKRRKRTLTPDWSNGSALCCSCCCWRLTDFSLGSVGSRLKWLSGGPGSRPWSSLAKICCLWSLHGGSRRQVN